MPKGPGIDRFDVLIGELLAEGAVETRQIKAGPYDGFQFRITDKTARRNMLPEGALEAIEYGLEQVERKNGNSSKRRQPSGIEGMARFERWRGTQHLPRSSE